MSNCLILMATYNGEQYIYEQIMSIRGQTHENWRLIIRDDGSNDRTVRIIEEQIKQDSRISLIKNSTDLHGSYSNFWTLVSVAKRMPAYDYYFFADQDDIWLPEKLEKMISAVESKKDIPVLAYADMEVIDGAGKLIYESLNDIFGLSEIGMYSVFFTHGYVSGCDSVINRKLFDVVPAFPLDNKAVNIISHDNYYTKFALVIGEVIYLDFPGLKYRRHEKNVTSGNQFGLNLKKICGKAMGVFGELAKIHGRVYAQTLLTIQQMKKAGINSADIECIEDGIMAGGIHGARILKKYHVHRKQKSRTIGIYVVMIMGTYKKYMKEFMEIEDPRREDCAIEKI